MQIVDGKCQVKDCPSTQLMQGHSMSYCITNHHIQLKNPENREHYENMLVGVLTDDEELVVDSANKIIEQRKSLESVE